MTNHALRTMTDVGNPHVRFDEGDAVSGNLRHGSLLYKAFFVAAAVSLSLPVSAGIRFPEFRPGANSAASQVMVLGADGRGATGKFVVSRQMNANIIGQMDEAEKKFIDNAASATIAIEGETTTVVFECPVPTGMAAKVSHEPWSGDRVEFNVRPEIGGKDTCCFAANCGGPSAAHGFVNGTRDMGWSSQSRIVVTNRADGFVVTMTIPTRDAFGKIPESGDAFGVNFIRKGPTCGNHSVWAPDGSAFNSPSERFGTLVFGGAGPYFKRQFDAATVRCRACSAADTDGAPLVAKALEPVERAVCEHGDDVKAFAALEAMFAALDQALVAISLRRTPVVLYDNVDVWSDDVRPTTETKMLGEIVLKAPRNMRRVKAVALANLTDEAFLGNLKVVDTPMAVYQRTPHHRTPVPGIQHRFRIRRSVTMHRKNGSPCNDPLVDLPFGSLVELAPGESRAFYIEFDSKDMKPDTYKTNLSLVTATVGVPSINVPIKIVITADELGHADFLHMAFTHLYLWTFRPGFTPAVNCIREIVSRGYNTIVLFEDFNGIYPYKDKDGNWHSGDFTSIDRYIDAWIAGGLAKERMYVMPFIAPERDEPNRSAWRGIRGRDGQRIPFGTPEYDEGARKLVLDFWNHLRERYGIRKDQLVWYPVDEGGGEIDDPTLKSPISRGIHYAKLIKSLDRDFKVFYDPNYHLCNTKPFVEHAAELAQWFDYIELYRPKISVEAVRAVQKAPYAGKWTYHISSYESAAVGYRQGAWMNLRDGFEPESTYWHLDESSLFAGHPHGYGTCYEDRDLDILILSRRQLANDMSFEEGKLVKFLRRKFAGDASKLATIETIVKEAADHPSMKGFDAALEKLLDL